MEFRFPKAQAAKLLFLVLSLTLIPFVSTSLRSSYLYFLLNILIIVLGYESGILHVLMEPDMDKKPVITVAPAALLDNLGSSNSAKHAREGGHGRPAVVVEQTPAAGEKAMTGAKAQNMKKAPSVPSLFFIGSCDEEGDVAVEDMEDEEEDVFVAAGEISAQELFARAESFIGNFYNQLKIQREESWKKIHGFYHRTL